jgi:uncharacterized membrane protein YbjE (DUF340 family)
MCSSANNIKKTELTCQYRLYLYIVFVGDDLASNFDLEVSTNILSDSNIILLILLIISATIIAAAIPPFLAYKDATLSR